MRPVLSPARRRLWRDPQTLQLGRAEDRAVVLAGLDPSARAVLALLDGSRDVAQVEAAAVEAGCPAERARALLDLLRGAGLVVDAAEHWPEHGADRLDGDQRDRLGADLASLSLLHGAGALDAMQRRHAASVVVVGAGRVGAPLATLLAAAGVGTVDVSDEGTVRSADVAVGGLRREDVGRPRGPAARDRVREASPRCGAGPVRRADVVVLAQPDGRAEADAGALLRDGVPHLLADVRDTVGVVGPLVLPGRSSCLRCHDLSRADRDPDWPALAVQLSLPGRWSPACDAVLAAAVSAQAALQVLALLDGTSPSSVDGTLELALPDWRWRRRSWRAHPDCDCRWHTPATGVPLPGHGPATGAAGGAPGAPTARPRDGRARL